MRRQHSCRSFAVSEGEGLKLALTDTYQHFLQGGSVKSLALFVWWLQGLLDPAAWKDLP